MWNNRVRAAVNVVDRFTPLLFEWSLVASMQL